MQISSTFCALPWNTLTGQKDWKIGVCCMNSLTKENSEIWNIQTWYISDLWNNDKLKQLRLSMIQWKKSEYCEGCYKKEEKWLTSLRKKSIDIYKEDIEYYITHTKWDGTFHGKIEKLDIRLSNLCNLACRMCSGHSSTKRIPLDKLLWTPYSFEYSKEPYDTDFFWNDTRLFSNISILKVAGGEPLINKNFYSLLEKLISQGKSRQISLQILTNLTILPWINTDTKLIPRKYNTIFEMFTYFKDWIIFGSIDGYEKSYEKIRIGGRWEDIKKNMESMISFSHQNTNFQFELVPTIQRDNIYDFPKLYIFAKKNNIKIDIKPLIRPIYLSIVHIPEFEKKKIEKYYTDCIKKYQGIFSEIEDDFIYILNFMNSERCDENTNDEYQKKSEIMDIFSKGF